jgi:3'(2'), 5'-bisphosphate nucleotidase
MTAPAGLDALREPVVRIARRAGAAILDIYRSEFAVTHKDDLSPLTEADLAAHRIIDDGLRELTPDLPVLSEEHVAPPWTIRGEWRRYWLVDPLDGTREFVKRNGEFTVNIALIERGRPVLGVVFAPDQDYLAHAIEGGGAALAHAGDQRALKVVPRPRHEGPPRVAGSRSHGLDRMAGFFARLGEHELVSLGSSLKFCLIADGKADLYLRLGPTSEWDTAAGQCILEQAGGVVTDLARRPLAYNTRESLINPDFLAAADPAAAWLEFLPKEDA